MFEVRFPADQQEGTEATLAKWLKAPGETVKAHEPLAEIETDKVMVEVAAPEDGAISEIRIKEGDAVNPGDLLCTFGDADSKDEPAAESESPTTRPQLSPAVRHRVLRSQLLADPGAFRLSLGQRYPGAEPARD